MDVVSDPEGAFARIDDDFRKLAAQLGLTPSGVSCVPIAADNGDNVRARSAAMPWYEGPTLVELLDRVETEQQRLREQPLRLPIRTVNRAGDPGGLEGTVVSGRVRPGDPVRVQPSGELTRVTRIAGSDGDLAEAVAGQAVTIALEGTVDVSPGDLIVAVNAPAEIANQFEATVVWLAEAHSLPARSP